MTKPQENLKVTILWSVWNKSINDENEINSHAVEFLNLSSLISLGYIWLQYIEISLAKLEKKDESFYKSKIDCWIFGKHLWTWSAK